MSASDLQGLFHITRTFAESVVEDEPLLKTIVREVSHWADGLCICGLVSDDGKLWERLAEDAPRAEILRAREAAFGSGPWPMDSNTLLGRAVVTGAPVFVENLRESEWMTRLPPGLIEHVKRFDARGMVAVPMRSRGRVLGALSVTRYGESSEPFSADHLARLQLISDHAALTIQSGKLIEEVRESERRSRVLVEVTRTFSEATRDIDALWSTIVRQTSELFGGLSALSLINTEDSCLDQVAVHGADPAVAKDLDAVLPSRRLPLGGALASAVAVRTGEAVIVGDLMSPEFLEHLPPGVAEVVVRHQIRSSVAVPIRHAGQTIGALSITRYGEAKRVSSEDALLLRVLADEAGLALDSAKHVAALKSELREHRETRAKLAESEERLVRAAKLEAVGRFAGSVVHDFNNVLGVVLSAAELITVSTTPGGSVHGYAEEIIFAAQRAGRLTKRLLAFSRHQPRIVERVDVRQVIEGWKPAFERLVGGRVSVHVDAEEGLWSCTMDATQLEQVLVNLVANGRDAMPEGGRLEIVARNVVLNERQAGGSDGGRDGSYVTIRVTDTGGGIAPEVRERIFEPFFSTKSKTSGTGLGLATVYGIAKQNGGWVDVQSEVGQGTSFVVFLPRGGISGSDERGIVPPSPEPISEASRLPVRVLVVEDHIGFRASIHRILTSNGYVVLEAGDADAALGLLSEEESRIDVVLTDLVLPGVNGRELARRVVAEHPNVRVMFMSGYDADGPSGEALRAGSVLLQKPFGIQELLDGVRRVLGELEH